MEYLLRWELGIVKMWPFRNRILVICLAVLGAFLGACAEEHPTNTQGVMVSEVGEFVRVHWREHEYVKEYEYKGLPVYGDILVSEIDYGLEIAETHFVENEYIREVTNCRVASRLFFCRGEAEDGFTIVTCTPDSNAFCRSGNIYSYAPTTDGFGLMPITGWFVISKEK